MYYFIVNICIRRVIYMLKVSKFGLLFNYLKKNEETWKNNKKYVLKQYIFCRL